MWVLICVHVAYIQSVKISGNREHLKTLSTHTRSLCLIICHVVIKQSVVGGKYLSVADWHLKHTSTISHLGIYGHMK